MKGKKGLVLVALGVLLLLSAAGLSAFNMWDADRAGEAAQTVLKDLDRQIPVLEELDLPEELIPDYLLNPKMDMPTQEVDGRKYIGRIEIPVVEMSLPVKIGRAHV